MGITLTNYTLIKHSVYHIPMQHLLIQELSTFPTVCVSLFNTVLGKNIAYLVKHLAEIAQSVQILATRSTVQGSAPAPVKTGEQA
jgi:hypothetical protein